METALTLPLTLFMIVGTLQLFMMLQARLMTEHAAFNATRVGSLSSASCERMKHAAILTLLPTFARTDTRNRLVAAFAARKQNAYSAGIDQGDTGPMVWLNRTLRTVDPDARTQKEDTSFDDPDRAGRLLRLDVTLTFWFPLRIPFANWIIARSVLAAWGAQAFTAANPLMPAQRNSNWADGSGQPAQVSAAALTEFRNRVLAGHMVFPIQATTSMRMMTAPRMVRTGNDNFMSTRLCR